jgi:hypothetical protein
MDTIRSTVDGIDSESCDETYSALQQVSLGYLQIAERAKQVTSAVDAAYLREQASAIARRTASLGQKAELAGEIMATLNDNAVHGQLLTLSSSLEQHDLIPGQISALVADSKQATGQLKILLEDIQTALRTSDVQLQGIERKKSHRSIAYWVLVTLIISDLIWAVAAYGSRS